MFGCRREATRKIQTDPLICSSAYWLKTRAVAAHAERVNVREGQPGERLGRVDDDESSAAPPLRRRR